MKTIAKILATTFGTGFSPVAPGTVGSLFILIIYYFLPPISPVMLGCAILVLFAIGVWASTETELDMGHDASQITIDEVVGMLITLIAIEKTFINLGLGFLLFRFFDIVKIYPVNKVEHLPKGWGIMMDDVLAGIYGNIVLRIIIFFI